MVDLAPENAATYLRRPCIALELGGGVSNPVLLIESAGERCILKQSLAKLRVEQDWYSDRTRVLRESSALRQLAKILQPGAVPDVLFEEGHNLIFGMTCAPPQAEMWKAQLLRGSVSADVAGQVAGILG